MRFFIGCDVEGCPHGLRWEGAQARLVEWSPVREPVLRLPEADFPIPKGWYVGQGPDGVTILCDDHAPIDGSTSEEPGRCPSLRGRCGVCQNRPGVICDICGNGLGKYADPDARRALTEGHRDARRGAATEAPSLRPKTSDPAAGGVVR